MKVSKLNAASAIIFVLCSLFLCGVVFNIESLSNYSRALILPFFVCLYFMRSETKSNFFAGFLIACSLGELSKVLGQFDYSIYHKVSDLAYIIGYACLVVFMLASMNIKRLIKSFLPHLIVLSVFNIYIVYLLNQMILSDNAIEVYTIDFLIECTYNLLILLILSLSLLNYLYQDTKRGLLLFLASVCIVFSEMIQVAYVFVSSDYLLNVTYSILLVAGFYIVYVYIVSKTNKFYNMLS